MEYYKTMKLKIDSNVSNYKRLQECNKESASIWNFCLSLNRERFEKERKLYEFREMRDLVDKQQTNNICANNKRSVWKRMFEAYKAISKARKAGRTDLKYPHKEKKFYPTEWDYQYIKCNYEKNELLLTMGEVYRSAR